MRLAIIPNVIATISNLVRDLLKPPIIIPINPTLENCTRARSQVCDDWFGITSAAPCALETISCAAAGLPFGVTALGETLQVAMVVSTLQLSFTMLLKLPPVGETFKE
jgi:hypothetical protein